ncbi:MAG: hypothetical protein AB7O04_02610 [Hyphomonadaceae bacterium]
MRKHWMIAVACAAAFAACSRAPTQTQTQTTQTTEAVRVACPQLAVIAAGGESHCGVALTADAVVTLDGAPMLEGAPLIVTSGVERRAQSLMVYPTPGGRFVYVRGCEGPADEPGLCWRSLILDRDGPIARDFTPRSHYGPSRDIFWSPDGERFAIIEPMESYEALTLVNPETASMASHPAEGGVENWRVEESSIRWTGNRELTANVEICNGDTGACAAAAPRAFTAD